MKKNIKNLKSKLQVNMENKDWESRSNYIKYRIIVVVTALVVLIILLGDRILS